MSNKQTPNKQQPSPAELITAREADIRRLEHEREAHVARGVELAERRKSASYAAHVQHDPQSRKQLDDINTEIGAHGSELQSFDDALVTARAKLNEAQQALAREEERARIIEQRRMNAELRKLGSWLDRAVTDYADSRKAPSPAGHDGDKIDQQMARRYLRDCFADTEIES